MIVDCHTHWNTSYTAAGCHDPTAWLEVLDRHGVMHAVVLPMEGLADDRLIRQENDDVAAACSASSGRMISFCTVNPHWGKQADEELIRCLEVSKHRGLKIHPWLQGVSPNGRDMDRLCEIAAEHDIPVLFHDGTPCSSLPSQIALLARRHPRAKIILGHCGLYEHWREAIAAMDYAENLWGCLCGPHLAALRELLRRCDPERLLWGSDFGYGQADPVGYRLGLLDLAGAGERDRYRILVDNPRRVLGLPPVVATERKPWILRRPSPAVSHPSS